MDIRQLIKYSLAIFIPLSIAVTLFSVPLIQQVDIKQKETLVIQEANELKIKEAILQQAYSESLADIGLLAKLKVLQDFVDFPSKQNRVELESTFSNFLTEYQHYAQVRFLDIKGLEKVRVDYKNGKPVVIPPHELQDKSERYYFKAAFSLPEGEKYISPLDLNVEHGKVETPYNPMIRFSTPVFDEDGNRQGVLVTNYRAKNLLGNIRLSNRENRNPTAIMLLNAKGYWLIDKYPDREWGFMLDKNNLNFTSHYPDVWNSITNEKKTQIENNDGIFLVKRVDAVKRKVFNQKSLESGSGLTSHEDHSFYLVNLIDRDYLNGLSYLRQPTTIAWSIFTYLLMALVSFLIALSIKKSKEKEKEFIHLIESVPDGILVTDAHGKILQVNQAIEDIFGYKRDELLGNSVETLVPLQNRKAHKRLRESYNESPLPTPMSVRSNIFGMQKKGDLVPVMINLNPFIYGDGVAIISTVKDMRDIKNAIEEKEYAEYANKAKSRFLANMSHELRTPMHAIMSFASLALKKADDEKQIKFLQNIRTSGIRLTGLLNELLDLSKLEAGKMQADFVEQDLTILVEQAIAEVSSLINAKKIDVKFNPDNHYDCMIDQNLMMQVLINLLSNAIKFSDEKGCVEITINRLIKGETSSQATIIKLSVIDQGIGIPAADLDKVFDLFEQSEKTKNKKESTGLGLPITKEIIQVHHGKVWAESPPQGRDRGTVFHVEIPILQDINKQLESYNIEYAIEAHLLWVDKINNMCETKIVPEYVDGALLANSHLCTLGQWIDSNSIQTDKIEELKRLHDDFHSSAGECVAYCEINNHLEAQSVKKQFDIKSKQIIALLKKIQKTSKPQ